MKKELIFLFLFFCGLSLKSQVFIKYSELGPFGGVSYYMGELNPGRQFFMVRPSVGLIYRYNPNPRWTWRIHGVLGSVQAEDALSKEPAQIQRNLSFRSQVIEFATILEFNFFPYEVGNPERPFTPFIFGGIALFRYNPKAELAGDWVPLQPLGTEGQGSADYSLRKPYSLINGSFPFGIGFKFHAFNRLGISLEWGLRHTFTDYLDDVSKTYADPDVLFATNGENSAILGDRSLVNPGKSNTDLQRGNPGNKDWYSFAGLTLTYKLVKKGEECPAYR
jgi:hypothetical protein